MCQHTFVGVIEIMLPWKHSYEREKDSTKQWKMEKKCVWTPMQEKKERGTLIQKQTLPCSPWKTPQQNRCFPTSLKEIALETVFLSRPQRGTLHIHCLFKFFFLRKGLMEAGEEKKSLIGQWRKQLSCLFYWGNNDQCRQVGPWGQCGKDNGGVRTNNEPNINNSLFAHL